MCYVKSLLLKVVLGSLLILIFDFTLCNLNRFALTFPKLSYFIDLLSLLYFNLLKLWIAKSRLFLYVWDHSELVNASFILKISGYISHMLDVFYLCSQNSCFLSLIISYLKLSSYWYYLYIYFFHFPVSFFPLLFCSILIVSLYMFFKTWS